jgi:hypothetical protein
LKKIVKPKAVSKTDRILVSFLGLAIGASVRERAWSAGYRKYR